MSQPDRVKELDCLQRLAGDLAHVCDVETLVLVVLDEIIEALAQRFEHEAHVGRLLARLRVNRSVHEPLLQVDNSTLAASVLLKVSQNLSFSLRAFGIPRHCSDHFHCVDPVFVDLKTL